MVAQQKVKGTNVAPESHHLQNRNRSSSFITSFQYKFFFVVLNTIFKQTILNFIILGYFLIGRIIHVIVDGINKVIKSNS